MKKLWAVAVAMMCVMAGFLMAHAQETSTNDKGINGKWHFVLDTPGGDRDIDGDFTVDADGKVTGVLGKNSVAGTFKDGKLSLNYQMTAEETGETDSMKIMGALDDKGILTGNWQFAAYDGTFRATRPKA